MAFVIAELSNALSCVNDVLNTSGMSHSPYPAGGAAALGSVGTTEPPGREPNPVNNARPGPSIPGLRPGI